LLRKDGDVARISLTMSLLRGADDQPGHFVAVIEDGTELMLLQSELNRQALHDVSTGLPNRQYFSTYLESALRRADPARGVTLFHLDVDAFGMVCNSLGRRTGERLLVHVAQRLKAVMAREKAMIARFEGDEFGILVENADGTPDVGTIVAEINRELAEPVYFDDCGLAVSVSVGVVRRPPADWEPANVMRAAEQALRRAKSRRRGQWELFHHGQDASDRWPWPCRGLGSTGRSACGTSRWWSWPGVRWRGLRRGCTGTVVKGRWITPVVSGWRSGRG
jgi:diguanylate cyclase (GGDEF)-like protein